MRVRLRASVGISTSLSDLQGLAEGDLDSEGLHTEADAHRFQRQAWVVVPARLDHESLVAGRAVTFGLHVRVAHRTSAASMMGETGKNSCSAWIGETGRGPVVLEGPERALARGPWRSGTVVGGTRSRTKLLARTTRPDSRIASARIASGELSRAIRSSSLRTRLHATGAPGQPIDDLALGAGLGLVEQPRRTR